MPAIREYILRTALTLAMVTFGQTVSAQTMASVKTVKLTPETAEAEIG